MRVGLAPRRTAPHRGQATWTKASRLSSGLPEPSGTSPRGDDRQVGLWAPEPRRTRRSGRSGSACPSSAAGRCPSRASARWCACRPAQRGERGGDGIDRGVVGEPVVDAGIDGDAGRRVGVPGLPALARELGWQVAGPAPSTRGAMTCRIGRPYLRANAKSRSSCAGTPITAPSP